MFFVQIDEYDITYCINKNDGVIIYIHKSLNYNKKLVNMGPCKCIQTIKF